MNAKIKKMISLFIACCMCAGCFTSASATAAEYTLNERYIYSPDAGAGLLQSKGNNLNVIYYDSEYDREKNKDVDYIYIDKHKENGERIYNKVLCKDSNAYVITKEGSLLYAYTRKGKNKCNIKVMSVKGKVKATYPVKLSKKMKKKANRKCSIGDIAIKGNKIYYVLTITRKKNDVYYLQSYDIKSQKTTKCKRLKGSDWNFYGKNIYHENNSKIEQYTLNGKKICSYQLPEGETSITAHILYLNNVTLKYNFSGYDVEGRYIYYCNRNGVYRCDTKGNKTFELIYSGDDDLIFNPEYGNELNMHYFEVLENGDFYLFLKSYDNGITKEYLYKMKEE